MVVVSCYVFAIVVLIVGYVVCLVACFVMDICFVWFVVGSRLGMSWLVLVWLFKSVGVFFCLLFACL